MHYHGTPITPRERLYELRGRNFCVSFAESRDVEVCHQIGQSVMLDNGAYSIWQRGATIDWSEWQAWADRWLVYPTTWAVLPDSIDGDEEENDRLMRRYRILDVLPGQLVPVWHLHESLDRLHRLADDDFRVCFGSSGEYRTPGSDPWHRRISEAFDDLADAFGRVPWVHMLRGLAFAGGDYPFASADSTNVALHMNAEPLRKKGAWDLAKRLADIDGRQCPPIWRPRGRQLDLDDHQEGVLS